MTPELVRILRVTRNMTQAELAKKIGCSGRLIAFIERHERRLTERMANRFMVAFNLDEKKLQELRMLREAIVFDE
ncbi:MULTISPECIES: helix-turn-helix domain-containing protein [Bacillus]|uniref:helix-turn-helix domain-containing protein n=1 Tax=Bacillus TaxID=1386 RepID=UPI000597504B|nr:MULTISPECIES: helix-turn-helix transcriptional regulator [Bacillus]ATH73158.1 XRE family transcriptional regulator [Bacillus altitudinis]UYO34679.1 helix-turn-helix transcriptional regulator [Bacillus zhangzhouensis]WMT30268.1 helix-turn-helix transcriptional regulator [Bacillus aerius]